MPNSTKNKIQDPTIQVKMFNELIDHLCCLCNSNDSKADFYEFRGLTVELLSVLSDSKVSSKMGNMSQMNIGPFLDRLHSLFCVLIESEDIISSINCYYNENYMPDKRNIILD